MSSPLRIDFTGFWLTAARGFLKMRNVIERRTGYVPKGLGRIAGRIHNGLELNVRGRKFWLNPAVARAYVQLLIGGWNEPATHVFFHEILRRGHSDIWFVDVGASVGEFVIDMAGIPQVRRVVGFEPNPASAHAIMESARLNGFSNVDVVESAVSDIPKSIRFVFDHKSPTSSHREEGSLDSEKRDGSVIAVNAVTLDAEMRARHMEGPGILLIDVEGGELDVMRGGREFLQSERPLIVFEYNHITRRVFPLQAVRDLLGAQWLLYRLRNDGRVDKDLSDTWNIVAVSEDSMFWAQVNRLDISPTEREG